MIYSVYRYGSRVYDYYEGPDGTEAHAGAPPMRSHEKIGAAPEQASWVVPAAAKKVGSGPVPRGRIAVLPGQAMGDVIDLTPRRLALYAVAGYLAWRFLR